MLGLHSSERQANIEGQWGVLDIIVDTGMPQLAIADAVVYVLRHLLDRRVADKPNGAYRDEAGREDNPLCLGKPLHAP